MPSVGTAKAVAKGVMNLTKLAKAGKGSYNVTQMVKALSKNPEMLTMIKNLAATKQGQKQAMGTMSQLYPLIGPMLQNSISTTPKKNGKTGVGKAVAGVAGDLAGSALGAKAGAAIGTAIAPGIGTAAGAAIGGLAGGALGSKAVDATSDVISKVSGKPKATGKNGRFGPDKLETFGLDVALPILGDVASVAGNTYGAYQSLLGQALMAMNQGMTHGWSGSVGMPSMALAALPHQVKGIAASNIGNAISNRAYTTADTLKRNAQNERNMQFQAQYHAPGLFWNTQYVNTPLRSGIQGANPVTGGTKR